MAGRRDRRPEALVLDPGVLHEGPVCELQSDLAVEAHGGVSVQPWRDRYRAAEAFDLEVVADARVLPDASQRQAVVHLQKSRAATFDDLAQAWRILEPGGALVLVGPNTLGIVSAVKRLADQLGQEGIVVANRAKARAVRFRRDSGPGPQAEPTAPIRVSFPSSEGERRELTLETAPGVFSARKLDAGSAMLLEALPGFVGSRAPRSLVDLGCGVGVLGLSAATLWPECEVLLVDADARAVRCAQANVDRLGLGDRCRVAWWDAREDPLGTRFELALSNPPFHHRGPEVDLGPALAIFESLAGWLAPGARALLVANRTLPYERPLSQQGHVETIRSTGGYKLLSLKRSSRSSAVSGRSAPGDRSEGRSRPPTRSR
ncbi:MAG TPA: methyltransferase [Myxococcota bacterium]|nr:methyltransferase [Myxococcota bacterium]